jgi:O-succinylbenzoate synthase
VESEEQGMLHLQCFQTLLGYISASKRCYKEDIVEPEFVVNKDGTMDVTTKPGIGIEVNMKMLDELSVKKSTF